MANNPNLSVDKKNLKRALHQQEVLRNWVWAHGIPPFLNVEEILDGGQAVKDLVPDALDIALDQKNPSWVTISRQARKSLTDGNRQKHLSKRRM